MCLAGILGLCALLHASSPGVSGRASIFVQQSSQTQPASPAAQSQSQSESGSQPGQSQPSQSPAAKPSNPPPAPQNSSTPKKQVAHKSKKKKTTPANTDPNKTVVRHGSTGEPTTQLAPQMSAAQATRQREGTRQLLTSADANLQKLSGRQLNKDQEDTVAQIRKFMEQAKEADAAGDLERASKLAVKAHLLSEALANP
jgi:hypothetical protein